MIKYLIILVFFINQLFATQTIYIAAAANLKEVMPKIVAAFHQQNSDIKIKTTYQSSRHLMEEIIKNPKKYDIYLSANAFFPNLLYQKFKKHKPQIYAKGVLTLLSNKKVNEIDLINYLLKSNCIVIANPSNAPYGKAAIDFLNNLWILSYVQDKLIYAKNVADVVNYLQKCNAAIISKSLSYKLKKTHKNLYFIDIPHKLYFPINQGAILLSNKKEAKKFYQFLFSQTTKHILNQFGYK